MEEIKERLAGTNKITVKIQYSHFFLAATEQAPKFIREIKESRIKEGQRARFEAGFAGNPKPDITWYACISSLMN